VHELDSADPVTTTWNVDKFIDAFFEHGGKRFPPTNPGNAQLQPAMPITAPSITPERFA
jgi:hypothetical protein